MTNPHDKALQAAANELLAHGEFGTFEEANRRNAVSAAGAAISAYLSSIGGVVCAREPVAYACSSRPNALWSAAQFDNALPKNRAECDIPLHTPISMEKQP